MYINIFLLLFIMLIILMIMFLIPGNIEKCLKVSQNDGNIAINGVATALDNVYNLNPAFNIKRTTSTSRQVDVQANTVILNQLVTQLEIAKVSLRKETPLVQLIDRPILPLEKDKVGKLKSSIL